MSKGYRKPLLGTLLNTSHPLTNGLICCWVMDEGSGLYLNDVSGHGNIGTVVGATWVGSNSGLTLNFNAISDYVNCGDCIGSGITGFTVAALVKSNNSSYDARIISQYGSEDQVDRCFFLGTNGTTKYKFSLATNGEERVQIESTSDISTTEYQLVIGVWNGVTNKIYINGVEENSVSNPGSEIEDVSNYVAIGRESETDAAYWGGFIDTVSIYNRALSSTEIQSLYIAPYQMFVPSSRVKHWYVDKLTISFIADIQGASSTPSIGIKTTRNLVADVQGVSTTPSVDIKLARSLLADIQGASTTPSIAVQLARALIASIVGSSSTSEIDIKIARSLVVDIQGASTTSEISAVLSRALTANIVGASVTPSISIKIVRALIANILGESTTPSIVVSTLRTIVANIVGASTTPSIDAKIARSLSVDIVGASTTPSVVAKLARALVVNIVGTSVTPSITVTLTGIISWVASIAGVSTTPAIDVKIARSLSAAVVGTSVTPSISAKIARALLADIQGTSVTPDDIVLLLTELVAIIDTTIESLTPVRTIESLTPVRTIEDI